MSNRRILVVSAEVAPFAKVGGLADVAQALPKALRALGHDARIFMPAYPMVLRELGNAVATVAKGFQVKVNPLWTVTATLYESVIDGVPVYLIGGRGIFDGVNRSEEVYTLSRECYLFFAQSIIHACEQAGWIPDVVHANDWHTGFAPVMIREKGGAGWEQTASVFTIHNLAYQGEFGPDTIDAAGLPRKLYNMHQLENFGGVNFLKSGCVFAEQVNTVSPTYAQEIQTPEYGCRQWGLMSDLYKLGRLRGILNGIDLDFFNPTEDRHLPANYTADNASGKAVCKKALQEELGLPVNDMPIVSVVSRLSNQKGFDLMVRAAYGMLEIPVQFVVLGVGDPWARGELFSLAEEWPDRVAFANRFDVALAQRIYAGSDLFLMPSAFEPCGLGQLIALRYGTIPVVRRTGGLADTVFEGKNGFVFEKQNAREMLEALKRGVAAFHQKEAWSEFIREAMRADYGWERSAKEYVTMYEEAISARRAGSVLNSMSA